MNLEDLYARIAAEAAQLQETLAPDVKPRISLKGGKFNIPGREPTKDPIQVVVLDWRTTKTYYDTPYNPRKPVPAKCYAIGKNPAELKPMSSAPEAPQCKGCPHNEWGSDPNGGKGKACRDGIRLAVVLAGTESVYLLDLPRTSIKAWDAWVKSVVSKLALPIQFVLEIAFDTSAAYTSLKFREIEKHDDLERYWALIDSANELLG